MAETPPDKSAETYEPRREARVLHWDELSAEQRGAAKQAHDLVRAFIAIKSSRGEPVRGARRFLPHIDSDRRNQNILLDGGRGSGKTALLLTLLDLWTWSLTLDPKKSADDKDYTDKCEAWGVRPNEWPVVPLGIVDLQPLPEHTPVLRHLVEPLVRVIEALEDQGEREDSPPPWLRADAPGLPSRKAWNDLLRAIVADWDDTSRDRWSKLDIEECVHEIDRSVRDHQNLIARFRAFVDALVEDFRKGPWRSPSSAPLFVVPIDDADMNPACASDLLEALRMLHHPRVVFLLTGDSELFYRLAEEGSARMLRSPRGRSSEPEGSPVRDLLAVRLGHAVYDKVVPFTHRCEILPVPASERHHRIPSLRELSVKSRGKTSHDLPLRELLAEPMIGAGLPERLRALQDVDLVARRRKDERPEAALTRAVLHLWRRAIKDNPVPAESYPLAHLESRVSITHDAHGIETLAVSPLAPPPSAQVEGEWVSEPNIHSVGLHQAQVQVRTLTSLRGVMASGLEVPDGLLGALMLADHVAFARGGRRGTVENTGSTGFTPKFAQALYTRAEGEDPLPFGWPLFAGRTLLDLSILGFYWRRALKGHTALGEADVATMARWFLVCVAQLASNVQQAFPPLSATTAEGSTAPDWQETAHRVVTVAQQSGTLTGRELKLREWALGRALLLAAPESGLSQEHAEEMLDAFAKEAGEKLWPTLRSRAHAQRDERLGAVLKRPGTKITESASDVRRSIDEQAKTHPWKSHITAARPKTTRPPPSDEAP